MRRLLEGRVVDGTQKRLRAKQNSARDDLIATPRSFSHYPKLTSNIVASAHKVMYCEYTYRQKDYSETFRREDVNTSNQGGSGPNSISSQQLKRLYRACLILSLKSFPAPKFAKNDRGVSVFQARYIKNRKQVNISERIAPSSSHFQSDRFLF